MNCPLCPDPLDQAPLADWHGLPAHADCATSADRMEAELLAELEAMVLAEPDPRRHRHRLTPRA